jgi:hypothetical protein
VRTTDIARVPSWWAFFTAYYRCLDVLKKDPVQGFFLICDDEGSLRGCGSNGM